MTDADVIESAANTLIDWVLDHPQAVLRVNRQALLDVLNHIRNAATDEQDSA